MASTNLLAMVAMSLSPFDFHASTMAFVFLQIPEVSPATKDASSSLSLKAAKVCLHFSSFASIYSVVIAPVALRITGLSQTYDSPFSRIISRSILESSTSLSEKTEAGPWQLLLGVSLPALVEQDSSHSAALSYLTLLLRCLLPTSMVISTSFPPGETPASLPWEIKDR